MKWHYNDYIQWKTHGCPINHDIIELNICNHSITSLKGINNLTNLRILKCEHCMITSLEEIISLITLRELYCGHNKITSLEPIDGLINLRHLNCYYNKITSLEPIRNLFNLQYLYCSNNQLTSLEPICNLIALRQLFCSHNQLTSLEPVRYLTNLGRLDYDNNEIELICPNITRRLNNMHNNMHNNQGVYNDGQNVHNHNIQECIRKSISNVINIKPTITNIEELIIADTILTQQTKEILIEYCNQDDVHSSLNITFKELLLHVFNRIELNEHSNEIKAILNIEMNDSVCKCFTGRMSRLINCLNGFDPLVQINISENEQIGQIIALVREQLEKDNVYNINDHKNKVQQELISRGYTVDKINEWVTFIE